MKQTLQESVSPRATGDSGASLVEYSLLVSLIAVVCFVAIVFFGTQVDTSFSRSGSAMSSVGF